MYTIETVNDRFKLHGINTITRIYTTPCIECTLEMECHDGVPGVLVL